MNDIPQDDLFPRPETRRLCVFCGSRIGMMPGFAESARLLGKLCAARGIGIVYGGASIGLMGILADSALENGGEVIGIMPKGLLANEIGHGELSQFHVVESMHERKALMAELSDGFVALPGGIGTFEEILEITTWRALGIHSRECLLLNIDGYFNPLLALLDEAVTMGFLKTSARDLLQAVDTPPDLLDRFEASLPPRTA